MPIRKDRLQGKDATGMHAQRTEVPVPGEYRKSECIAVIPSWTSAGSLFQAHYASQYLQAGTPGSATAGILQTDINE